jgi:dihydroflavonol-4-reductase
LTLASAIKGCEALIHTAAITSLWPYRSMIQRRVNIEGTSNIMKAAIDNSLRRIIHVGTANSFGFGPKSNPGDETKPYMAGRYRLDYLDTKLEAQTIVLKMAHNHHLPALIVNPTFMFGPYASRLGSAKMIESVYLEKVPGYTRGGRNYIAVKDVCFAIANALEKGKIGENYILGNENLNYNEIFTTIAEVTGVKEPKQFFPDFIVKSYGLILTQAGNIFRFEPPVSYRMAEMSCDDHYYKSDKAISELDLPQTPIKTAIKETFDWLNENGYFNKKS